jgi:hypothetical protein
MKKINFLAAALAATFVLSSCGRMEDQFEQTCHGTACTEADINAPVDGTTLEEGILWAPGLQSLQAQKAYSFPAFDSSWGLPRRMYDKAQAYYRQNLSRIGNTRYVSILDFSQHSSKKRYYLFDLATGKVERHNTSHGVNSDRNNNGYATQFSNTVNSKQSSLGFYLTLGTYTGKHGYSMRLRGLESTNSNAERRAVVVHPARYVSNAQSRAGRSWGCPALDPKVSRALINKIKGGSLMLIDR